MTITHLQTLSRCYIRENNIMFNVVGAKHAADEIALDTEEFLGDQSLFLIFWNFLCGLCGRKILNLNWIA